MRLIHCADLHIDSKLQTWLSEDKAKERRDEILSNFPRLVEFAKANMVSGIMIAGDLYDRNSVSKHAENAVMAAIEANPRLMFYYLPGNHDDHCFLSTLKEKPQNLIVFDDRLRTYRLNQSGSVTISGIALTEDNNKSFYDDISLNEHSFNIFMLHGEERTGGSSHFEECLQIKLLRNLHIDYLAMGHVHKPSLSKLDDRGMICYPGCLEGRGFDECGPRGFYMLDINENSLRVNYTFVPFAKRRMLSIEVFCEDCMKTEDIEQRIEDALTETDYDSSDYIKIVLKGKIDALCEKDIPYLLKYFEKRAEVVRIEDETELRVDYDSFANDMSLKGEFVRLVAKTGYSAEDKAEIIRLGIEALMGEDIS